ncbi:LacI family DNA-binding transcriptional regulator [Actinoplanes aureus]|uniref:LacI family DNA-binding transcriptional regulator n=1 Tax=Actinoplanes aureus TaxID=2792083 RepID=A0A931G873_9ACTN|nr:LacI family DNA-binding transcriptional regulator [Actinoplanes aureus]MBG0568964.1 LacI family DNA-binding transcriptional regulator [Actinoplanes aureus]
MSGKPTMNDVARTAGVSLKTVSRVVNGEPSVTPDLAARVRAAVESLDYRPHLGASMLRRNDRRTRMIGVLLEDVANPFSGALHRAIEDAARDRGVHVLTGSLDEDEQRERDLARAFRQRQTDGLIVAPAGSDQSYLSRFTGTPIVFVDRPPSGFGADTVVSTNVAGAAGAVRHLVAHGHRRIAFLGDYQRRATARERFRGYLQALGHRPGPVVHDVRGEVAAERATLALLRRADAPTALFTGQNLITIGAVRALQRIGLHQSIALVGFDDFPLADLLDPPVTVVAQHPARMGRAAADALFERIDGHNGPPREIRVATTLIPRGSGEIRIAPAR